MIDQSIIDKIIDSVNIVDVIGEYVSLAKKGVNYWGICPFHADRNPSMCVSPTKQIFKCFSCGEAGNVISFLEKYEHMSYPEAIKFLGKKCNIDIPDKELAPEEQQLYKQRESLHIALEHATGKFKEFLAGSKEAQDYLNARGWDMTDAIFDLYRIGYAPGSWRTLTDAMKHASFDSDIMIQAGLSIKGEKGVYDAFRDRIIFPYFDLKGKIIGFTGRLVHNSDKSAKYYNTGETLLFHKGNAIFGLFQARQAISRQDKVYFVEGQFDVLSMARAGIRNTVCGSGTALTPEQIKMMIRFTRNVTLVYDCDEAGIKASVKNIQLLLKEGANVRAISLPHGEDPDSLARKFPEKDFPIYLHNNEVDFVTYLANLFKIDFSDPIRKNEHFGFIAECIALVSDKSLKAAYATKLSESFSIPMDLVLQKIKECLRNIPQEKTKQKPGFYGIEELGNTLPDVSENCILTDNFKIFSELYGNEPVVYVCGLPSADQIQEFRRHATYLQYNYSSSITFDERRESDMLVTLCNLFKAGFTIYVEREESNLEFVDFYIRLYASAMEDKTGDIKTIYYNRCADIIASASDAAQTVMEKEWVSVLKLTGKAFRDLMKPYKDKKKSKNAMLLQQSFDDTLIWDDPDTVPSYVEENEEYSVNYRRYGFYPLLNKEKEPVSYMFRNPSGSGHTQVADFYMIPLLHVYSSDSDNNKRIMKINRRFYKRPVYLEVKSKTMASLNAFEETLMNEEGLNFENGTVAFFKKIRQAMSYKYTMCDELKTYGQQPENFYAFANAIFHEVDGKWQVDMASDIGVVTHNEKNYYAPAFSNIYAGLRKDDDIYESIRYFVYKNIPIDQQCSFEHWASLMNRVYKVNDNGKWAIIYSIMCAFRSDIHPIDRLFTALFFMGPTMSGKTQIAVSIRSLYIDPDLPAFNLNTGTDAALYSLMEGFRDVPQVLDEYNNKDISDYKFQALKSITYDGDGKQKRKSTSGKDIETSKVYSPVIILGQETPQRDDNALMNRVVICEVPKKTEPFTPEETALFQELKSFEKNGLSNILFEVLKLRPTVRKYFKSYMRTINKELSKSVLAGSNPSGDMTRIMNTVTLFLSMCKLMEEHAPHLKLPFSYDEFYQIASKKVITQVEMITRTDKLAGFFKAMEVMINTKSILEGRDYAIDQPDKLTIKLPGNERREIPIPAGAKVLYLRLSSIHTLYAKSSFNTDNATQSTIEANIRSNPAYIGIVNARRFKWEEVKEVPRGNIMGNGEINNEMIRVMEKKSTMTSCIALNYDVFRQYFDIDLERTSPDEAPVSDINYPDDMPFEMQQQDLPY